MNTRAVISLCLALALLTGCASLGIFGGADYEFEQGLALFNRGQYDEAIPYFLRATELDVNHVNSYIYLGRSHLNMGRWTQALPPLRTAYRIAPDQTRSEVVNILIDALLGAALDKFKKGDFTGSLGYLKEGLALQPGSERITSQIVSVLLGQGETLIGQGKIKEAVSSYTEALDLAPNTSGAYVGLAKAFMKNGDFLKALNAAEKAFTIDPSSIEAESLLKKLRVNSDNFMRR
ncbi:MAG: hypothetical protein OHK006_08210 [Thermodesulfovibrionales bacterium]